MSLGDWNFSFSTAPAARDGRPMTELPGIKMELMRSHRYDEVLSSQCHAENCADFTRILPKILSGEETGWFLWNVIVKVDRLILQFGSRTEVANNDPHGGSNVCWPNGTVNVIGPTVLGLRFTLPPIDGQSEILYECMMSSSGSGHSHNLQLSETKTNPTTNQTICNTIHFTQSIA